MRKIKFRDYEPVLKQMRYFDLDGYDRQEHDSYGNIMQFTGLLDADGKEIFEGDLLDFDEREWGGKFDPEVITMDLIIGEYNLCGSFRDLSEWRRVIGNIYEHPHLIKQS